MKTVRCLTALLLVLSLAKLAHGHSLGWIPMADDRYQQYLAQESELLEGTAESLPTAWDWREFDAVTAAKDQGQCGSCWAFATTAAMESHIILDFDETYDLAEQTLVSCNGPPNQQGCCGGELDSILFYEQHSPRLESCYPYGETNFANIYSDCPPTSMAACYYSCAPVCYNVTDFYTLDVSNPSALKRSIFRDGPSAVGFNLYEDFYTYWDSPLGTPPWEDGVYYHASGDLAGGHGVLAFGWDDAASAYILKNSWGKTGPFGDGTFRMRTDQLAQAVNFRVIRGTCGDYAIRLSSETVRMDPRDHPCKESAKAVRAFYQVDTPFPERIRGGTWYTKTTYSTGDPATIPEPIPNADYVSWIKNQGQVVKNSCIQWSSGDQWVVLEYWLVDSEGVESAHRSFMLTRDGIEAVADVEQTP